MAVLLILLAAMAGADTRRIVAIAHRGEHILNPENTLPAYREAIRVGADFVEVDVRTSADGVLVISHDATVDRRTNGHGKVAELSFEQLRALDAGGGARIPSFDEVLDLASGKIGVYVDVKQAAARDLVRQIASHGMTDAVVIYCGPALAREILGLEPRLKVMPEANSLEHVQKLFTDLHPKVLAFDDRDFRPEIIRAARDAHALIYVDRLGAVDNSKGWQAAIDAGADGIQTDHPQALVEFLRTNGYK